MDPVQLQGVSLVAFRKSKVAKYHTVQHGQVSGGEKTQAGKGELSPHYLVLTTQPEGSKEVGDNLELLGVYMHISLLHGRHYSRDFLNWETLIHYRYSNKLGWYVLWKMSRS